VRHNLVRHNNQPRPLYLGLEALNFGLSRRKDVGAALIACFELVEQGLAFDDPRPVEVDFVFRHVQNLPPREIIC
jgi:hypothetical protein